MNPNQLGSNKISQESSFVILILFKVIIFKNIIVIFKISVCSSLEDPKVTSLVLRTCLVVYVVACICICVACAHGHSI